MLFRYEIPSIDIALNVIRFTVGMLLRRKLIMLTIMLMTLLRMMLLIFFILGVITSVFPSVPIVFL